jgi:hypothetical protein
MQASLQHAMVELDTLKRNPKNLLPISPNKDTANILEQNPINKLVANQLGSLEKVPSKLKSN